MSTLHVVEEILRERRTPMVVREIVEVAGARLPTKSRTPDTVVARDLAMDIKRRGEESLFARVAPGKYTLREYAPDWYAAQAAPAGDAEGAQGAEAPAETASAGDDVVGQAVPAAAAAQPAPIVPPPAPGSPSSRVWP